MNTTSLLPVLYCPHCKRSTEAVEGSELACPRCGTPRVLFKFGGRPAVPEALNLFERPRGLEEALQAYRQRLPR